MPSCACNTVVAPLNGTTMSWKSGVGVASLDASSSSTVSAAPAPAPTRSLATLRPPLLLDSTDVAPLTVELDRRRDASGAGAEDVVTPDASH
jgi:hypothetical protein